MSPSIWTQCGGKKRFKKLSLQVFRVVQPQTQKALYKLVDNLEESDILEELLESSKPPKPSDDLTDEKLIFTPFRYPPLKHGSRFGSGHERGIWYGAPEVMTDFYEVIYYRYLFREHSPGLKSRVQILSMTSFEVKIESKKTIDLTRLPFKKFTSKISSAESYGFSQPLGSEMRRDGVEVFKYFSARSPKREINVGVFVPHAIRPARVFNQSHWTVVVNSEVAIVEPIGPSKISKFEIARSHFLHNRKFPLMKL